MSLYHLIGRLSSPFQVAFFSLYNHVFHVPRARVLVWNESGELLLVRNWGGKQQWGLPGGGVKRNEALKAAAKRELFEEVGLDIALSDFAYVTTLHYQYEAPIFAVDIQRTDMPKRPHNPREITHLHWFTTAELPEDISPLVPLALEKLSKLK